MTRRSLFILFALLGLVSTAIAAPLQVVGGYGHTCSLSPVGEVKCWGYNSHGQLGDGTETNHLVPRTVIGLGAGVRAIAAGQQHTCALTNVGGVKCWGSNQFGMLGDGTTTDRNVPVAVVGLANGVLAIAAGPTSTCAVTDIGDVRCWGDNTAGRLGDGTTTQRLTPVSVGGLTGAMAVSVGGGTGCAITSGGLKCWGANDDGQIGDGTTAPRLTATQVAGLSSGVTHVAVGYAHVCARTTSGAVKCWGDNSNGQLGDGTTTDRPTPVDVSGLSSGAASVASGLMHVCAVTDVGTVRCWGNNAYGQLGGGTTGAPHLTPADVQGLPAAVSAIAGGDDHSCAASSSGALMCWGANFTGQLGDGSYVDRSRPTPVPGVLVGVAVIAPGGSHSCALSSAGAVSCWGTNGSGELGDGTTTDRLTPGEVSGLGADAVGLASGSNFTCALTTAGGVKCWGYNNAGAVGDGTYTNRSTPTDVSGLTSGVLAIAAGTGHACAVKNGVTYCWGSNDHGQLGDGTTNDSNVPVPVVGFNEVAQVVAGEAHSCLLTSYGGVACWGRNDWGQLGDGTVVQRLVPTIPFVANNVAAISAGARRSCIVTAAGGAKCWGYSAGLVPTDVPGLESGVASIATGIGHSCVLTEAGGVKCWGENGWGQVGDGTTTSRPPSIDVVGLGSGVVSVATGPLNTCAIMTDSIVKCWGENLLGQLGTGTPTTAGYTSPVQLGAFQRFIALESGTFSACALNSGGGVKCWGWNSDGQLGDGTTTVRTTAVDVAGLESGVVAVSAGYTHACALTNAGGVKCWGRNGFGSLGDGTGTPRLTAVDVFGLTGGVKAISVGERHSCALLNTGGVSCWGANEYGQVGDGTTLATRPTPVNVIGLSTGVTAISAGAYHSCALTSAGGVKCWGFNRWGQLGDGAPTEGMVPVDVGGLTSGVVAISSGDYHTCALTSAGSVKCWGRNYEGQLGDGTTTNQPIAVDVANQPTGVVALSGGSFHTCALTNAGSVKCWGELLGRRSALPVDVSGLELNVIAIASGYSRICGLTNAGAVKCKGSGYVGALGSGTSSGSTTAIAIHQCGDGSREPGEACDDGNGISGDCCSPLCDLEQPAGGSCQTTSYPISSIGGTVTVPDRTASISIPAGALASATPISITGQSGSTFNLGTGAQTAAAADFGPNGQTFASPATITLSWLDTDDNGIVQGTIPPLYEGDLIVYHNGAAVTGRCSDLIHQPGTCTTACCDPLHNTWTFQTSSFSEFAAASQACDPISGAQLKLTKLNKPGANGLSLKGKVSLSPSEESALNPLTDGLRLVLSDSTSGLVDMVVPGGAYDAVARKGWKVNGSATTWTFVDMTKPDALVPTPRTGISKVVVKRSTSTPGSVTVQVTGKNAAYDLTSPPVVDVVLNKDVCFRASFPGPGLPLCYYNGSQTTLVCR